MTTIKIIGRKEPRIVPPKTLAPCKTRRIDVDAAFRALGAEPMTLAEVRKFRERQYNFFPDERKRPGA